MKPFPQKWRPSLSMVVVAMLLFVLCLPLGGIWVFRFYDSQLVRETENELIAQGAFIKAIARQELEKAGLDPAALAIRAPVRKDRQFHLILPQLDLSTSYVQPPRADAAPPEALVDPAFLAMGRELGQILHEAQKTTLAGFRVLDPNGVVVAGGSETGLSLANVGEVQIALNGRYASVIRQRISDNPSPRIYSISRGTGIRVFVAMPIEYEGKVAGAVYLSRTPSHFLRELYDQRWKIGAAISFMLIITLIIAFIFIRAIKGPVDALNARTKRIAAGDRSALEPLDHHGTREIASLSQGLLSMSEKLQNRSDYIRNFANHVSHELKSPLTSIKGAAELLREEGEDREARQKFLGNIVDDTDRLTRLLDRLRELAAADSLAVSGSTPVEAVLQKLRALQPALTITHSGQPNTEIPLPLESAIMVFANLADNSVRHEASEMVIRSSSDETGLVIQVRDNGTGISAANREKVLELFFTTRRTRGGTGMGLGIVQSALQSCDASLSVLPSEGGACFEITFPHK